MFDSHGLWFGGAGRDRGVHRRDSCAPLAAVEPGRPGGFIRPNSREVQSLCDPRVVQPSDSFPRQHHVCGSYGDL